MRKNAFYLSYNLAIIFISVFFNPIHSVLLAFYAIIGIIGTNKLSTQKAFQKFYLMIYLSYPIFETVLKILIHIEIIESSFRILNRIEHMITSAVLVIIFLPFFIKFSFKIKHIFHSFLFAMFIGILVEIFEFTIRVLWGYTSTELFSFYYRDTILDLTMNIMGGTIVLIGFFFIRFKILIPNRFTTS